MDSRTDLKKVDQQQKVVEKLVDDAAPVPTGGLWNLTKPELDDMAKQKGVSLNITKKDVLDKLDELEPGVDHSGLSGVELVAQKQKLFGKSPLKTKPLLIKALEKAAGEELAQQAKQVAHQAAAAAANWDDPLDDPKKMGYLLRSARIIAYQRGVRVGMPRAEQEDLAGDILLRVVEKRHLFNPAKGAWSTWVSRVANSTVMNALLARVAAKRDVRVVVSLEAGTL
ncbi:MAG TPA: sigma factor [Candidatus Hydrogenedentes bacterium]|nr:sigma factor [Candidatus Hydrogenedentota bacterium]HOH51289.1 sigma factor [Candidatus Hydrogenedentota bacterium]